MGFVCLCPQVRPRQAERREACDLWSRDWLQKLPGLDQVTMGHMGVRFLSGGLSCIMPALLGGRRFWPGIARGQACSRTRSFQVVAFNALKDSCLAELAKALFKYKNAQSYCWANAKGSDCILLMNWLCTMLTAALRDLQDRSHVSVQQYSIQGPYHPSPSKTPIAQRLASLIRANESI